MPTFAVTDQAESFATKALFAGASEILIADGFFVDPDAVRENALAADFTDWQGHDGQVYKRVCLKPVPGLQESIERVYGPVEMFGQGYRLNFAGEQPNQSIRSDLGWGTHAAVIYLCEGPGGTAFWRHSKTGASRIEVGDRELFEAIGSDWEIESAWSMTGLTKLAYNRAVLYDNALFHSRYPFEAFGTDKHDGRLIAVAFFTPETRK
jgi:hypothetical protein